MQKNTVKVVKFDVEGIYKYKVVISVLCMSDHNSGTP